MLVGHPKSYMEVDDPKAVEEKVMRSSYDSTDKAIGSLSLLFLCVVSHLKYIIFRQVA